VEPLDPLLNLEAAVTRRSAHPGEAFRPWESFALRRALRGLTWDSAWGAFWENQLGRIQRGWWADLVVLDRDPHQLPLWEMNSLRILGTWHRGEIVYVNPEV
jgi:predicted amidohydrolase YtcJ